MTRRRFLGSVSVYIAAITGCLAVPPPESGSQANLGTERLNISKNNGNYTIEIVPEIGTGGDWEPFRNVEIVVENMFGETVCREPIGDLTKSGEYDAEVFTCDSFPHTITYEFDRDLCDEKTGVQKLVYNETHDVWRGELILCDE